jgi:hypothetical protein
MKYGQISIGVAMDSDLYPDIVITILIWRDLKNQPIEPDTVVVTYGTPMLLT